MDFSGGVTARVVALVSDDKELYMDFLPYGSDPDRVPTYTDMAVFERIIVDAVAS